MSNVNLLDLAKLTAPDGSIAPDIVQMMMQVNDVLLLMPFMTGNQTMGHQSSSNVGLPKGTYRRIYGKVKPTKANHVQLIDNCAELAARSLIDKTIIDLAGKDNSEGRRVRMIEDQAHIEGMSQQIAEGLIYGNAAETPEHMTGLAPRFSSTSNPNGRNIFKAGDGGTKNRSIWLVVAGDRTVSGITPKGSSAGIEHIDMGLVTASDGTDEVTGGAMLAYESWYYARFGLMVKDWRYVCRICNIDLATATATFDSGTFTGDIDLPDLMFKADGWLHSRGAGRGFWMMDRATKILLQQQTSAKTLGSTLGYEDVGGKKLMTVLDMPIAVTDALETNETSIT